MGEFCVTLTSVLSLLEVKRGLMVVPKPTMLSLVPGGRLFSAITMASCRNKAELTKRPDECPKCGLCVLPLRCGSCCHSCFRCDPPETAALWWLCEVLQVRSAGWDRSSASGRGCSECLCGVASSQTPTTGDRQEQWCVQTEGEGGLFETPGEGNASEHQPSYWAPNLFECSGWNPYGRRSVLHTGRRKTCLSLRWPAGCELLWIIKQNQRKEVRRNKRWKSSQRLTAEMQNDFNVSVIWMLLSQGDVGGRGALGAGVCICPQSVGGTLQTWSQLRWD